MGFLTTITFYNDAVHDLKDHPEEVAKLVDDALHGVQIDQGRDYDPIGSHANPVIIQKPRHADDTTIYIHAGNTVTDVYDIKETDSNQLINDRIKEVEFHLKRLKEIRTSKIMEKLKVPF